MPALKLCGQPSFIGGDDIRCCLGWYWLLRVIQISCIVPILVLAVMGKIQFHQEEEENHDFIYTADGEAKDESLLERRGTVLMLAYAWTSGFYVTMTGVLVEGRLWRVSGWGTPTLPGERTRQLQWGIYIKFGLLGIVVGGLTVWGIFLWKQVSGYCQIDAQDIQENPCLLRRQNFCRDLPTEAWETMLRILVVTQFMEFGASALVTLNILRRSAIQKPVQNKIERGRGKRNNSDNTCCCWTRRAQIQCMTWCCCSLTSVLTWFCTGGGETPLRGDFATLAALLDDFVGKVQMVDVVFSDILMSLTMLRRLQKQRRLECQQALTHPKTRNVRPNADGRSILMIQETTRDVEHGASQVIDVDEEEANSNNSISIQQENVSSLSNSTQAGVTSQTAPRPQIIRTATIAILNPQRQKLDSVVPGNDSGSNNNYDSTITATVMSRRLLCPNENPADAWALAEGAHYMKLAVAIYTLIMQMTHNPTQECWNVFTKGTFQHLCCTRPLRRKRRRQQRHDNNAAEEQPQQEPESTMADPPLVVGDFACGWHERSFLHRAGLTETELVYASFRIGVARTPYAIVLDHDAQSVVVIIRGTLSLDDLMADLTVQPQSLDPWNEECFLGSKNSSSILDVDSATDSSINNRNWTIGGAFAHKGILDCAAWVFEDLKDHGILSRLLVGDKAPYKNYSLRCCGHSLGAGIACLVGLFLRPKYLESNDLRCLCFCPPGCTVSRETAEKSKDFITSYVLDSDLVPRLSLQGLENLRDDILQMVARVKVSKHKARARYSGNLDVATISEKNAEILYDNDGEIPESDYASLLEEYQRDQETRRRERSIENVPLWPPGNIVYLANAGESIDTTASSQNMLKRLLPQKAQTQYQPIWAETADFREIELTSHFLDDHDPENVLRELERLTATLERSQSFLSLQSERQQQQST